MWTLWLSLYKTYHHSKWLSQMEYLHTFLLLGQAKQCPHWQRIWCLSCDWVINRQFKNCASTSVKIFKRTLRWRTACTTNPIKLQHGTANIKWWCQPRGTRNCFYQTTAQLKWERLYECHPYKTVFVVKNTDIQTQTINIQSLQVVSRLTLYELDELQWPRRN